MRQQDKERDDRSDHGYSNNSAGYQNAIQVLAPENYPEKEDRRKPGNSRRPEEEIRKHENGE